MKEVVDSVFQQFNNRLRTPFYGLLTSWWVILHFEFFYTLLFVDESKIYDQTNMLKNEYLHQKFWSGGVDFWFWQGVLFSIALLLTLFMIYVLPRYVLVRIHAREQDDFFLRKRKRMQIDHQIKQEQLKLEQSETETIKALEKTVVEQSRARKKIEETDPTALWKSEYKEFGKTDLYNSFDELIELLYTENGKIPVTVNKNLLSYAEGSDLVAIERNSIDNTYRVALTDKGKFFVKQYQTENN